MRYFLFLDSIKSLAKLHTLLPDMQEMFIFSPNFDSLMPNEHNLQVMPMSELAKYEMSKTDRGLINMEGQGNINSVMQEVRAKCRNLPIMIVDNGLSIEEMLCKEDFKDSYFTILPLQRLIEKHAAGSWGRLKNKEQALKLLDAVDPDKQILILLQSDPDPDAMASGIALRQLLGRDEKSAPLVSLKPVSRSENLNMLSLLGIKINRTTMRALGNAEQLAIVDSQPKYFKQQFKNMRLVIDHHPYDENTTSAYTDVRPEYGATSAIMTEYLRAMDMTIDEALATALYYGIKTDTLILGRDVSLEDFDAFIYLWPKVNIGQISQMERPRLGKSDVEVYLKALQEHIIVRGCLFVFLGKVENENIVPRLADFVLQIGSIEFAIVWAEVGNEVTFAARSMSDKIHAGEVLSAAFGEIGSAGGHKSMARATMQTANIETALRKSSDNMLDAVRGRILRLISKQKSEKNRAT